MLYFYCIAYADRSPSIAALSEDHRNDILSNTSAIITAALATWRRQGFASDASENGMEYVHS